MFHSFDHQYFSMKMKPQMSHWTLGVNTHKEIWYQHDTKAFYGIPSLTDIWVQNAVFDLNFE